MATKKKTASKKAAAKKTTPKKTVKKKVSMSAEIRDYLEKKPAAGPKEVRTELAKKGIKVSEALVSNVKYQSSQKKPKRKVVTKPQTTESQPLEDLQEAGALMVQAVDLVLKAGGKEASQLVKMAVDVVRRINDENKQ